MKNIPKGTSRASEYHKTVAGIYWSYYSIQQSIESVKMYGQALLDIATYKFIFGTEGQNLKDMTYLYNLTEDEQEFLRGQQK